METSRADFDFWLSTSTHGTVQLYHMGVPPFAQLELRKNSSSARSKQQKSKKSKSNHSSAYLHDKPGEIPFKSIASIDRWVL